MTTTTASQLKENIEEIARQINQKISKQEEACFFPLIASIFKHIDTEDIKHYKADDLQGLMSSLHRKIQTRSKQLIDVFNPNVEEHGWQSPHTIVLLHHNNTRYIIDSLRNTLNKKNIKIHNIFHAYLCVERDTKQTVTAISDTGEVNELLLYIEIDQHSNSEDIKNLVKELEQTVKDVDAVAKDYKAMVEKVSKVAKTLKPRKNLKKSTVQECKAFLDWLKEGHFTFLAYDEYSIDDQGIKPIDNSGLGLFKRHGQPGEQLFEHMSSQQLEAVNDHHPIVFAKSGHLSSVHRAAYSDYVVIKKFDSDGKLIGGYRFMGLYKHNVYLNSARDIPVIREKILSILTHSGIEENTYNYAELAHILETFPRDELFQASGAYLLKVALDILYVRERSKVKLFLREDLDGKFINVLFYAPKDRLNSKLQNKVYELLSSYIDNESSTTSIWFSESSMARCRFVFKLKAALETPLDPELLERKVINISRDWNEDLHVALNEAHGEEQGILLHNQYAHAFPASYSEENSPRIAVVDIERMQQLSQNADCHLSLSFYRNITLSGDELKIKIYHKGNQLSLSEMIPVLENFGLNVIEELPYDIVQKDETFWIYNFTVDFPSNPDISPKDYKDILSNAFTAIWQKQAENDGFNELILKAGLNWRQISMLRAYSRYMKQIAVGFSQKYIANSLVNHTGTAKKLVALFDCLFNPEKNRSEKTAQRLITQLEGQFEQVASLSEDRILRQYLELMQATLRTNFFQKGKQSLSFKDYLSFKLAPGKIKNIPLPCPQYEIFVYSPRVEGVHLRGGKVARGGLRWSDRTEDFRTEILGLVKAQQVKNAVIVPVGAKGGFIAKNLPSGDDREAFLKEGVACYQLFIRGLLDVTDNLIDGEVVPPHNVVRYDDDDIYLVVAADKGTATFSDIANEISNEYGHWLGDAFASGGSNGYDHKKMGITARGAWVSVQRHFREMGINIQNEAFSVVGIGDMSGDVFGNGMLLSEKIKLVGAFNHQHIFIDPTPDCATSFAERKRLFDLPRSSWADYDQSLLSEGGAIFKRSDKSISLSRQIQQLLNTQRKTVTPNELLSMLLKSSVDMLWNGGIGTYVKASSEQHTDVGDKSNDAIRINACDLQCKVVGEGGNLGLTQQARIEYGLLGGSIFTDFIDNAAGVDCSDHEVNIKVLLDKQVNGGELTENQRNRQLESMTEAVAKLVLENNYKQTQAIALAYMETGRRTEEYRQVINYLESTGNLNRELEFLPSDEELNERKIQQSGLTQAELSILISYVKADMKEVLVSMELGDDPHLLAPVTSAFPQALLDKFYDGVINHPLKKEIIATQVANDIFNHMGISYVDRMQQSTGATHEDIAKAYIAAKEIFSLKTLWQSIEALDYTVSSEVQHHMMLRVSRLIRRSSRWLIKNHRAQLQVSNLIDLYAKPISELSQELPGILPEPLREQWQNAKDELLDMGAPENLAETLASCEYLYDFLGIISASNHLNKSVTLVASGFFSLAEKLDLDDFSDYIENKMPTTTLWQSLARESLRDDLEWQQRQLTQNMFGSTGYSESNIQDSTASWLAQQEILTARWKNMILEINNHQESDISIFSIAIRELSDLSQATSAAL